MVALRRRAGGGTVAPPYATRMTDGEVPEKSSAFVRLYDA
jgi:hypothetical protein